MFIDEIHRLVQGGKAGAEWLLHLLQDGVLVGPLGPEEQPKITVIAATTDGGRLPDTLVGRFAKRPVLEPYTDEKAARIGMAMAGQILPAPLPFPSEGNFAAVAVAANNNPRTIGAILSNLRDLVTCDESIHDGDGYDLSEALDWLGLSPDGLTAQARAYLRVMFVDFGAQAGELALMDRLNEPGGISHIERLLVDKGYVAKRKTGRVLTAAGIRRAKEEVL
jgi:Holliday junction resolvasome RuvABC ATP-dependent DNA helicase subunit